MKLFAGILLVLALVTAYAGAQSTTASSTGVVDTDGFTWAGGTVTVSFVPSAQHPSFSSYSWTGGTLLPAFATGLSNTGTFSISLPSNTAISPTGSQWAFQLCPNATKGCFSFTTALTGATQDLTASINALAVGPRFPGNTSTPLFGYGPVEINTAVSTATIFFNTTTDSCQQFNGTAFQACGTSSGGGLPAGCSSSGSGNITCTGTIAAAILTGTVATAGNITATSNSTLTSLTALTAAAGGTFGTAAFQPTSAFVAAGTACILTGCTLTGPLNINSAATGTGDLIKAFAPSLATGSSSIILTGTALSTNNAAGLAFNNVGGAGSALNTLTLGLFGDPALTISTSGALTVPGLLTGSDGASISGVTNVGELIANSIQNSPIGTATPSTGAFTSLSATGAVTAPTGFTGPLTGNASTATTAANLSGTPALPNGTSATTQASGDNTTALATDAFVLANSSSGGLPSGCSSPGTGSITCTGTITDAGEVVNGTFALNSTSTAPVTVFNSALANGGTIEMMIGEASTNLNGMSILYQKVSTGSLSNSATLAINGEPGVSLSVTGGLTAPTTRRGTFTCTAGGTITVAATKVIVGSDIVITLETAGGVITTVPAINSLTAGTGFNVLCGTTDTSVYRFSVLN